MPEEPSAPQPDGRSPAREVFDRVRASRIALVLGRDGQDQAGIARVLSEEARRHFAASRIRTLNLPVVGPQDDDAQLFRALSREAGLEAEAATGAAFQAAVAASLKSKPGAWLWLVFGFENPGKQSRERLAGIVRALGAVHGEFQVVLLGGERLYALSYGNGALSIFFGAAETWWPDLEPAERTGEPPVDPNRLARARSLAGGHPLLTADLLHEDHDDPSPQALIQERLVRPVRTLAGDRASHDRLRRLATLDDLGPFPLIHATLLTWTPITHATESQPPIVPEGEVVTWLKQVMKTLGDSDALSVAWSPDGSQLVSGSGDNTMRLWEVASGSELRRFEGPSAGVYSVAWNPDGSQLAAGSARCRSGA